MFQAQGSDHVVVKMRPIFTSSHACKQQHWASPSLILLVATWQTSVRKSLKLAGYEKYTQPSAIYQAKYCLSTCQLLSWLCQTALGPFITPMKYFVVAGKPSWESESCGLGVFFFEHFFDVRVIHCFKGSKRIKKNLSKQYSKKWAWKPFWTGRRGVCLFIHITTFMEPLMCASLGTLSDTHRTLHALMVLTGTLQWDAESINYNTMVLRCSLPKESRRNHIRNKKDRAYTFKDALLN